MHRLRFHAIHIMVDNGHVTVICGTVLIKAMPGSAYVQANGAPFLFGVDNNLVVQGSEPGKEPE